MEASIQPSPKVVLQSMIPGPFKSVKRDILWHFLTAAGTVISRHWKLMTVPSLGEWAIEQDPIIDLEGLLAQEARKEDQFSLTWTAWSMFRYSSDFQTVYSYRDLAFILFSLSRADTICDMIGLPLSNGIVQASRNLQCAQSLFRSSIFFIFYV